MITHVFDATALIELLGSGEAADKIEEVLSRSRLEAPTVCMSAVNWGEVYYTNWHRQGREFADQRSLDIYRLPILIVDADRSQARLAAELKAKYHLPYADAFAAAAAISHRAKLVTADADFQVVESKVDIVWLVKRPRKH